MKSILSTNQYCTDLQDSQGEQAMVIGGWYAVCLYVLMHTQRIEELDCTPHTKQDKYHWNEDKFAVCFTHSGNQASTEIVLFLTDLSLQCVCI